MLVVDDNSPDGTGRIADDLAAKDPAVDVVHRPAKGGLGPAYREGLGLALQRGYDVAVEMDADLSHDPADLPQLIAATETADLVIGSRYVPGGSIENWPAHRLALSSWGNRYVKAATGIPVRDATSGFRAMRRELLEEIPITGLRSDGYSFQLETVVRAWTDGWLIRELPITFVERRDGASKISRAIVVEALWRVAVWGLRTPRSRPVPHPRSVAARVDTIGDEVG